MASVNLPFRDGGLGLPLSSRIESSRRHSFCLIFSVSYYFREPPPHDSLISEDALLEEVYSAFPFALVSMSRNLPAPVVFTPCPLGFTLSHTLPKAQAIETRKM